MKRKLTIFTAILTLFLLVLTACTPTKVEVPKLNSLEYASERTLSDIELPKGWEWVNKDVNPTVDKTVYQVKYGKEIYEVELVITKATPDYVEIETIKIIYVEGITLNEVDLLNGWDWKDPQAVILEGLNQYPAIFTPSDTINYKTVQSLVGIEAIENVVLPTLSSIVYSPSVTLANVELPEGWSWSDATIVPTVDQNQYFATYKDKAYSIDLEVEKAIPIYDGLESINIDFVEGKKLSSLELPQGWSWKEPETNLLVGVNTYKVVFTPSDTINYLTVELDLTVVAYDDIEIPVIASVVYSPTKTLSDIILPTNWEWENDKVVPTVNKTTYSAIYTREDLTTVKFDITLVVEKAIPILVNEPTTSVSNLLNGSIIENIIQGEMDVEGLFAWTNSEFVVQAGDNSVEWTFTPTDNTNYKVVTGVITVEVAARAKFVINVEDAVLIVFDELENPITPENGLYILSDTHVYTYQVTKTGYVSAKGEIALVGGVIEINLEVPVGNQPTETHHHKNPNGITNSKTPTEGELLWATKVAIGWTDAPSVQTIVDNSLIVMAGTSIIKYDLHTGIELQRGTMVAASSWGYTPVIYAEGMIFAPLSNGTIQAFNAKTLESLWVYQDKLKGQALSPITYHDGYIYTGFWNSETANANFVAISITDEDTTKTHEEKLATWTHTQKGGFYWAGSVVVGDVVIVGTDDGESVHNSPTSKLLSFNRITGEQVSSLDIIGDQRSTITYDEKAGKIYFVSKNAYLYKADVDSVTGVVSNLVYKEVLEGWQSTSTPIVYNGRIYIGLGQGFSSGKIAVINEATLETIYTVDMEAYPQAQMLLSTGHSGNDDTVYVYTTYNGYPGGIYVITDKPGQTTASGYDLFVPEDSLQQYNISTILAGEDGILYFKNDSGYVFAVRNSEAPTATTTLKDGKTYTNKKVTFDLWAKDKEGNKIPASNVTIKLNGDDVTEILWDDNEKTSYKLELFEYENTVEIIIVKNGSTIILEFTIYFEEGATTVTFSIEAFTLGNGFLVEPQVIVINDEFLSDLSQKHFGYIDIGMMREELRATYLLDYVLEQAGLGYYHGGTMDSSFYLSVITGFYHHNNVSQILYDKVLEEGGYIDEPSDNYELGEFDYTYMSGWMYSVNDIFPNVGFADYYPQDGDVFRVQFTLYGYGLDLGAGGFWGESFFPEVNRHEIVALLALIDYYGLIRNEEYLAACALIQEFGIIQDDLDLAYENLYNSYIDYLE